MRILILVFLFSPLFSYGQRIEIGKIDNAPFKIIIPENTDDSFKEEFLLSIFELIKDRKLRMMPTSSEIKVFLKKNREYMDLLPVGVRL